MGVLENDMVTYLVKAGPTGDSMFTEEGKQLSAIDDNTYHPMVECSGRGGA